MKFTIFFVILLLLPLSSALQIYQENSSAHSFSRIDYADFFINDEFGVGFFDGDWEIFEGFDSSPTTSLFLNYSIPDRTLSAIWEVKDDFSITNFTLPQSCLSSNILQLTIETGNDVGETNYSQRLYCNNIILRNVSLENYRNLLIFEEAVIFDVEPETPSESDSFIYTLLSALGHGLGSFIQSLAQYLLPFILILAIISLISYMVYLILVGVKLKLHL